MFVVLYICKVSEYLMIFCTDTAENYLFKDYFIIFIMKRNPILTSTSCTKTF